MVTVSPRKITLVTIVTRSVAEKPLLIRGSVERRDFENRVGWVLRASAIGKYPPATAKLRDQNSSCTSRRLSVTTLSGDARLNANLFADGRCCAVGSSREQSKIGRVRVHGASKNVHRFEAQRLSRRKFLYAA